MTEGSDKTNPYKAFPIATEAVDDASDAAFSSTVCAEMLRRRTIAMWCTAPYLIACAASLMRALPWSGLLLLTLLLSAISVVPLSVPMYRLVKKIHGNGYAIAHVFFLFLLTPAFAAGPILLPLMVKADANRLLGETDQN